MKLSWFSIKFAVLAWSIALHIDLPAFLPARARSRGFHWQVCSENIRVICEICSELTIKISERRRRHSGVFIGHFKTDLIHGLMFSMLALIKWMPGGLIRMLQWSSWLRFNLLLKVFSNTLDFGRLWDIKIIFIPNTMLQTKAKDVLVS